jgi:hypothetical protein
VHVVGARGRGPLRRAGAAAAIAALAVAGVVGCGGDPQETTASTAPPATEPPESTTTTEAPVEAGQAVYVYRPSVGDCFDRRRLGEDGTGDRIVLLLDCELPHAFQVFAVFDFDDGDLPRTGAASGGTPLAEGSSGGAPTGPPDWPGEDTLAAAAKRVCPPLFAEWIGLPYERSELELGWVVPDEGQWIEGDRVIGCTVWDPMNERMGGDSRGIAR